ncbi:MAG: SapC family protein [Thermodesulfobacteriaceae bacterium]|nr:SapC family protein [Thermodesulfobacteriaceae bacterium]
MKALMSAFKKAIILDSLKHREVRVRGVNDYSFMEGVEIVPLAFSEILSATMYYPVMFGVQGESIFPFAVLGANKKNVYLKEDGTWKVDYFPKVAKVFPFGLVREGEEYLVLLEEEYISEEGERLFDEDGKESEYFSQVKEELTALAKDLKEAEDFSQEVFKAGCLKVLNLETQSSLGKISFKNVLMTNIEVLSQMQPEKLYLYNLKSYLLILYAQYLSLRNFVLFEILNKVS